MKSKWFYLMLPLLTLLLSCSSDDSESDGSGNTTDVAVTGRITEVGMSYAQAEGYVNLDKLNGGVTPDEIGIAYESNGGNSSHVSTKAIEGRKISVKLTNLLPGTTYQYKTYVKVGTIYQYGETKTFKSLDGTNITTTGEAQDITFFSASLKASADWSMISENESAQAGIIYAQDKEYLTKLAASPLAFSVLRSIYSNASVGYQMQNPRALSFTISFVNLDASTQYFYSAFTLIGSGGYMGEIKEFTTKAASDYIQTGNASNVTQCTATVECKFNLSSILKNDETATYSLIYATSEEDLADEKKRSEIEVAGNSVQLFPMLPDTKYYYRAKAVISDRITALGDVQTLITKDLQQTGAVDLGLSCKWGTCNLGASSPIEDGYRYAWGETEPKSEYSKYNYTGASSHNDISGTSQDAATLILGQPWRMPNKEEAEELIANCSYAFGKYKNVNGSFYMSADGTAIFLPEQGYWTSTPAWIDHRMGMAPDGAYEFHYHYISTLSNYSGLYIRPVQ